MSKKDIAKAINVDLSTIYRELKRNSGSRNHYNWETAETLCVSYGSEYEIDTVIARLSHTYGPYFTESDNRVYAQFIRIKYSYIKSN